ncbi:MAG: hypothetical protein JJ931_00550 [Henriciella sp.]|jgi:hypothetical protein|nr:hypothetical protein [Henriciella sp.]MBO6693886.1 hypothetical protein [Henriciella sp.]
MTQQTFKSASKRYWRAFVPIMLVYLVATLAGSFYLKTFEVEPVWLQTTVAVACTLPMLLFLFIQIRYFLETDEYNQMIQLKGFAIGSAITVGAIFLIGFLQMFHVVDQVEVFWFGPAFFIAYGLSTYLLGGRQLL